MEETEFKLNSLGIQYNNHVYDKNNLTIRLIDRKNKEDFITDMWHCAMIKKIENFDPKTTIVIDDCSLFYDDI